MSSQAGIWNFDGAPVEHTLLEQFSSVVKQYGPDGRSLHVDGSFAALFYAFHTTHESRRERQPHKSTQGTVFTWDGRLDNRDELLRDLGDGATDDRSDLGIVVSAFTQFDTDCFRRLEGDWAVSIWSPANRELILAVDYVACRHLFYYLTAARVWWSTHLAPLVLLSRNRFHLDDDYISGYFANDPDAHLTPYREIRQVPAGHFVRIQRAVTSLERYWRLNRVSCIRYKTDSEYEEHFQHVFRQSVRRRLRTDSPVLAELSGGLDSSSIVCMADQILRNESARTAAPRLDTLSYFDTTEPNGDDWVYFRKVEDSRGRTGAHIDTGGLRNFTHSFAVPDFSALPGNLGTSRKLESERSAIVREGAYRVTLSGMGGDELMGGIPDPSPELGDLLVCCNLFRLSKQLMAWGLVKRRPWMHLLWQAGLDLLPASLRQFLLKEAELDPWIKIGFANRTHMRVRMVDTSEHFGLCMPTRRYYTGGVIRLANKLAKCTPSTLALEEVRYPFLDQSLVEYVLSIPANQLLRPGQRRSLMRRSLRGVVPPEILSRRTKQFAERTPIALVQSNWKELQPAFHSSLSSHFGYIDDRAFLRSLEAATVGKRIHIIRMLKTIGLEFWLQDLNARGLLAASNEAALLVDPPVRLNASGANRFPPLPASKVVGTTD
jgi:asparagine synthase (glutamine-hydrolysing)